MKSYRPEELFGEQGQFRPELAELAPKANRRMGANPHTMRSDCSLIERLARAYPENGWISSMVPPVVSCLFALKTVKQP